MAQKGWWGDKLIISLSGKDQRRQKNWCVYYRPADKFCTEQVCKCMGASHCKFYKKKHGVGPVDFATVPQSIPIVKVDSSVDANQSSIPSVFTYIPGHNPSFGEKLMGQIVLMKNNTGHITVGEVVFENHDIIAVEKDNGDVVKYSRRVAVSMKTFWVLDDV